MHNPRVAWLLTVAPYYWHPLLRELTHLLPQTTVFTAGWPGFARSCKDTFKIQVVGERRVFSLGRNPRGYGNSVMYLSPSIVRDLFRFQPDVIFADGFCLWTLLVLLLKLGGRWQVVIVYDGSSPTVDARQSGWRLGLRRLLTQLADAFITNNSAGKAYLTQVLRAKEHTVFVRPYLVPDARVMLPGPEASQPLNLYLNPPVFLYVGKLIPRKGVQELLEACLRLNNRGYNNYTLLIVGDGEQREELGTFCQRQGLDTQVQWIGPVVYSDLGAYFQLADVFIFPSLEDVWGMVVPEAMAFGQPVLCSQWAGSAELVLEGENGYRFDPHTPEQLADLMGHLIDQPEMISRLGGRSLELISQHSPEAAAKFLVEVTSWVLEHRCK